MKKTKVKIYNKGENDLPNYATELSAGFDIRADLSRVYKLDDLVAKGGWSRSHRQCCGCRDLVANQFNGCI